MGLWVRPGGLHQGPKIETPLSHVEISSVPTRRKWNKLAVICRRIDLSPLSTVVTTLREVGGLPRLWSLAYKESLVEWPWSFSLRG